MDLAECTPLWCPAVGGGGGTILEKDNVFLLYCHLLNPEQDVCSYLPLSSEKLNLTVTLILLWNVKH
jgi:hypothetical protein